MFLRLILIAILLSKTAPSVHAEPVRLPNGTELKEIDFERHVTPMLLRFGCSTGNCHGSFSGKGGFRLSLFGDQPAQDHRAITRGTFSRRIDLQDPSSSLLLLKPTASVPHEGGQRFDSQSWAAQVLKEWIAQGAKYSPGKGEVTKLEPEPKEIHFDSSDEVRELRIIATFADGSRLDVTPFCDMRTKDDSIAEIASNGTVRRKQPGDTVVIVAYRGTLTTSTVLVPSERPKGFVYPYIPQHNFIDKEVFAKLRSLNIVPSDLCEDGEFLRRVTLDTIGTLPTPEEVIRFRNDPRHDKRQRKIEELLTHSMHAALWATRWSDITGNNIDVMEGSQEQRIKQAKMWHDWLRKRFEDNVPWDQIAKGILSATSREGKSIEEWIREEALFNDTGLQKGMSDYAKRSTLDLFWRRNNNEEFFPIEQMAELTASAFMGVRIECAQCHKHPFDKWTQVDYRSFANLFGQVKYGSSDEQRAAMARILEERRKSGKGSISFPRVKEIYFNNNALRKISHPDTKEPLVPRILGGSEVNGETDARSGFIDWLTQKNNSYFARAFVNRLWAHYFGSGLVEPVDNFSVANPPTNPLLLDALANEFIRSKFDIRHVERLILSSRTYQLSNKTNDSNHHDTRSYSHSRPRKLMAEVVIDMVNTALDVEDQFGSDVPKGSRAIEIAPNRIRNAHASEIFRIFGRPVRKSVCDCERSVEVTLPQTLFLMTDPKLLNKMQSGRLKRLLDSKKSDEAIVEELFLATLSRSPEEIEKRDCLSHLKEAKTRTEGFQDLLWALINTREFILNH
jgi:hypothetical protein